MPWSDKLARFKHFLRQVWHLSAPYFSTSAEKWKARGLLAAIVALNLGAVYMLVLLNEWNRVFFDALQNKNQDVFLAQLGRFTWLAMVFIVIAVYRFYLTQLLQVRWRAWMTRDLMHRWLGGQAFYRMELQRYTGAPEPATTDAGLPQPGQRVPDNPDQRLQEDVNLFTTQTVGLSMGFLNAVVTLASFVGVLWGLSGSFSFSAGGTSFTIPGFMVWMAVLYCAVGSVLTHYIGRPLIGLNFEQQKREADFRHHLVRVREYSEAIALDKGERVEEQNLDTRFTAVLANYLRLIAKQKQLVGFTNLFGQAAAVFPFIIAAPRFFSGAIQLGELMQIGNAFDRVQGGLSWFVDNYDSLAAWRATTERLTSFEAALSKQNQAPALTGQAQTAINSEAIEIADLTLQLPTGATLLQGATARVAPGEHTLLQGPSGSGKSTLLRALAGIWPWARGRTGLPEGAMFIPQRPYFPDGPLRDALAYPEPAATYSDEQLKTALQDALLPALAERLTERDNWTQKLSGGEQQRLAIARVLISAPRFVILDEATSALDTANEARLYRRLLAEDTTLISIAHRAAVLDHHTHVLELTGGGRWALHQAEGFAFDEGPSSRSTAADTAATGDGAAPVNWPGAARAASA